jgi:hypothetical protein
MYIIVRRCRWDVVETSRDLTNLKEFMYNKFTRLNKRRKQMIGFWICLAYAILVAVVQ